MKRVDGFNEQIYKIESNSQHIANIIKIKDDGFNEQIYKIESNSQLVPQKRTIKMDGFNEQIYKIESNSQHFALECAGRKRWF